MQAKRNVNRGVNDLKGHFRSFRIKRFLELRKVSPSKMSTRSLQVLKRQEEYIKAHGK